MARISSQSAPGLSSDKVRTKRVTTGSLAATTAANITVTWDVAFPDANYTVVATAFEGTGGNVNSIRVLRVQSIAAGSCVVRVINDDISARTGTIHAIAIHD